MGTTGELLNQVYLLTGFPNVQSTLSVTDLGESFPGRPETGAGSQGAPTAPWPAPGPLPNTPSQLWSHSDTYWPWTSRPPPPGRVLYGPAFPGLNPELKLAFWGPWLPSEFGVGAGGPGFHMNQGCV